MTGPGTIRYAVDGHVARVTIDRPDVRNALTPELCRDYTAALRRADADPGVRAVLVTGTGQAFCAGADLAALRAGASALDRYLPDADNDPMAAARLGVPVVAALNGPAVGIGFALALAADIRFAAPAATLNPAFPRLGLTAEYACSWLLNRLIGTARTLELLLSGRGLPAQEALGLGLVTRVVEPDRLEEEALAYTRAIAQGCSPRALAAIKQQVLADQAPDLDAALARSAELMRASFRWPDLAEAVAARGERRDPRFPARPVGG